MATPSKVLRARTLAALLLALGAGCGGPAAPPAAPATPRACAASDLDACATALAGAIAAGRFDRPDVDAADRDRLAAYATELGARDPAWARVRDALASKPTVLVVAEGAAASEARAAATKLGDAAKLVELAALADPPGLATDDLVAALAASSGVPLVVRVRPGASRPRVDEIVAADPLAPFLGGVGPGVRDDAALDHLAGDVDLEARVRRAIGHASAFRYVEAAREAAALEATLDARADTGEPVLRARHALDLLASAGLGLEAAKPAATVREKAAAPPPRDDESPYGALLRVRAAKSERDAWAGRRALVVRGLAPDRVAVLDAAFADAACSPAPPPIAGPRDLVLLGRLPAALAREPADEARGRLPLGAWLPRHEAATAAIDRAGTAFAHLATLLVERGELHGLHPAGTSSYRRGTELGARHLAALAALEKAEPDRFHAMGVVPLAYAPGLLDDERLRADLVKLLQASVADKVARAADPEGVLEGLLAGAFAGMSYPPAIRTEQLLAVQAAFAARLRGDLSQRTGWPVAGLFAADAALRAFTKDKPGLEASALHVARALEDDRALPRPALGALAASASRYAALAAVGELDPGWKSKPGEHSAERQKAREALRRAIAGLGEPGEAPNNVLDDVTDLADGVIAAGLATLEGAPGPQATEGPAAKGKRPARAARAAKSPACDGKGPPPMDPRVRRTFAKLGDVRRRILAHPRFKAGEGAWVRRARLFVALLSDVMDVAARQGPRPVFTVPATEAERFAADALREWEDRGAAEAVASTYGLARAFVAADRPDALLGTTGAKLRGAVGGLLSWFRKDASGTAGVALVDALAAIQLPGDATGADATRTLLAYSKAFRDGGKPDQADLCLLGALLLSTIAHTPPAPAVLDAARAQKSRVEWALRFADDSERVRGGAAPNPASYAPGVKAAEAAACAIADVDTPVAVMEAVRDFGAGKRVEARRSLDELLARMESRGLALPLVTYRYEERTATKVLALSLGVSLGSTLVEGASSFQLGLGVRSAGAPEGQLTTTFEPPTSAQASADAARYYVYVSSLAAAYHFLDGDRDHATRAAHRAIAAVVGGVRLGDRRAVAESQTKATSAARAVIALDAELAAEAGLPLLAGDLFSLVRGALPEDADDAAVAKLLDPAPTGLAGLPGVEALARRTQKALRVLADPLVCTEAKIDRSVFEKPACESYPIALSLRVADVLAKLPRLAPGTGSEPGCAPLRALDAFLGAADKGSYDPDAFTRAVEALHADGRAYDAAVLLSRQRREGHCSPALSSVARSLGRSPLLGPSVRADLLAVAVNCAAAAPDPRFEDDVLALDAETRALPDPSRNFRLALFLSDLALRQKRFELLARLAAEPRFVERWTTLDPMAATAALVIDHASQILTGKAIAPDAQRARYELVCETFPPGGRAPLCDALRTMRAGATRPEDRERVAREALAAIVTAADRR
jgi:hypothetical protein